MRPDIRAFGTGCLTCEPWLQIGEPGIIRPPVAAYRGPMAAVIVAAIDEETSNATGAHFGEANLV
jgi:hypothetical protein